MGTRPPLSPRWPPALAPPLPTFHSAVLPPLLPPEALLLYALFFSFAFEDINYNVQYNVNDLLLSNLKFVLKTFGISKKSYQNGKIILQYVAKFLVLGSYNIVTFTVNIIVTKKSYPGCNFYCYNIVTSKLTQLLIESYIIVTVKVTDL